ncbi:MAG: peptidylprolyl isomerase [Bacteroidales bacterium]|nr:peptidylprolyl isomerase [Bacteroidales bacterium]
MRKSLLLIVLFLAVFVLNAQNSFNKKVLATIGNQKVSVGSFLSIYTKNNFGGSDTTSISHAVDLYINFRLKVLDAENRKMDTLSSFKKELAGYRNQLVQPYFEDKKVEEALLKEAYERSCYDVRASHILIKIPPDASPADTLKAWDKIEKIRNEILAGKSFQEAAREYSEDPSARDQGAIPGLRPAKKGNGGDLGYFTVFNMVYPFETVAYNTPIGQISQPVRTRFGYHLIKVTDKRPAMGVAEVEHIFIPLKPDASVADSIKKVKEIETIYQKIKDGMSFEKAAKLYSQDKGSSYLGGLLPKFTSGRIVPQFVINVDSLKPGEVSKPFQTVYGFHIIKLISREKPENFKEEEAYLKSKINGDQRSQLSKQAVINRLKKEDHLKIDSKAKIQVIDELSKKLKEGKLTSESLNTLKSPLIKIGKKNPQTFYQNDFTAYIEKNQNSLNKNGDLEVEIAKLFNKFSDEKLIAYEKLNLDRHHPDFKNLMLEYHDGILLFNLTDKMVWSRATKDTIGLREYYLTHRDKYLWRPRVQAIIMKTSKTRIGDLESVLKTYSNLKSLEDAISKRELSGFNNLEVDSGYYEKGDDEITDQVKWEIGLSKPVFENGKKSASIVLIEKILPVGWKSFKDATGLVIADYQDVLQKQWISSLRKKYPVHINQKVLRELEKKYPEKK